MCSRGVRGAGRAGLEQNYKPNGGLTDWRIDKLRFGRFLADWRIENILANNHTFA